MEFYEVINKRRSIRQFENQLFEIYLIVIEANKVFNLPKTREQLPFFGTCSIPIGPPVIIVLIFPRNFNCEHGPSELVKLCTQRLKLSVKVLCKNCLNSFKQIKINLVDFCFVSSTFKNKHYFSAQKFIILSIKE